jgi:hypothetical protein
MREEVSVSRITRLVVSPTPETRPTRPEPVLVGQPSIDAVAPAHVEQHRLAERASPIRHHRAR